MSTRDAIILCAATLITVAGAILTFAWGAEGGLLALLVLALLAIVMLVLGRSQTGKMQERNLETLQRTRETQRSTRAIGEQQDQSEDSRRQEHRATVAQQHKSETSRRQEHQATVAQLQQVEQAQRQSATESADQLVQGLSTLAEDVAAARKATDAHAQSLTRVVNNKSVETVRQMEAVQELYRSIQLRWVMPASGGWALDARSILHLLQLMEKQQPKVIIEMGSGSSTIWLGYLAEKFGAHVYAFEHLQKYAEATQESIDLHGLNSTVTLQRVDLREYVFGEDSFQWYDIDLQTVPDQVDVLFVDGPPAKTGPLARYPAVPVFQDRLSTNSIVLLDDAQRPEEQEIVERWLPLLDGYSQVQVDISTIAVLQRRQ